MAVSEGYYGIGLLDADNWVEPDHIACCIETASKYPDADYLVGRMFQRRPDETVLPVPEDPFPDHVDTNCFFFLPGSFHMLSHFSVMPQEFSIVGDKVFNLAMKGAGMISAKLPHRTVNYSCLWPSMYRIVGETPLPEAKQDIDVSHLDVWLRERSPRELELIARRAGVRFIANRTE